MKKLTRKIPVFAIVLLTILIIYMLSLIVPMIWAIYTSLKDEFSWAADKILPDFEWITFENYTAAIHMFKIEYEPNKVANFGDMMRNSLIYSLGGSFFQTSIICITAYATSRFNFKFDKVIYTIVIITMILPIIGSMPSELRMARLLGMYNTMWGMFLMKANFLGMYYLVFHAIFRGIPKDFDEAAYMDGAGNFTIFFKIIFPLVVGTFVTIMLIKFIEFWNDYMTPFIYIPSFPTIAYGLQSMITSSTTGDSGGTGAPFQFAAAMIVFIPNFTVFIIFRNKLIGNISMGGLKE